MWKKRLGNLTKLSVSFFYNSEMVPSPVLRSPSPYLEVTWPLLLLVKRRLITCMFCSKYQQNQTGFEETMPSKLGVPPPKCQNILLVLSLYLQDLTADLSFQCFILLLHKPDWFNTKLPITLTNHKIMNDEKYLIFLGHFFSLSPNKH